MRKVDLRRVAKTLLVMLGVVVVLEVADTALHMWAWRTRNPRVLQSVKRYNKLLVNRVYLRFPGRLGKVAVIHHVGRRSGTPYTTPVMAHASHREVIVLLPYGTDVDWLRNLQAAGHGAVDLEGRSLQVDEPAVVDIDDVLGLLPDPLVRTARLNGTRQAARLHLSELASDSVSTV
jgi:deazaflavin-dependent oxidoreductase (nitroreductase family)